MRVKWSIWEGERCLGVGTVEAEDEREALKAVACGEALDGVRGLRADGQYKLRVGGLLAATRGDELRKTGGAVGAGVVDAAGADGYLFRPDVPTRKTRAVEATRREILEEAVRRVAREALDAVMSRTPTGPDVCRDCARAAVLCPACRKKRRDALRNAGGATPLTPEEFEWVPRVSKAPEDPTRCGWCGARRTTPGAILCTKCAMGTRRVAGGGSSFHVAIRMALGKVGPLLEAQLRANGVDPAEVEIVTEHRLAVYAATSYQFVCRGGRVVRLSITDAELATL